MNIYVWGILFPYHSFGRDLWAEAGVAMVNWDPEGVKRVQLTKACELSERYVLETHGSEDRPDTQDTPVLRNVQSV